MNTGIRKLAGQFKGDEQGGTLVMVTAFMVALFGFAALSIDVSRVFQEQRHINVGTDAGALAGIIKLTNGVQNATDVANAIAEAKLIAAANGVTTNEIAAGARNGFPGQVQVGLWSNSTFTANAQDSSGRYNAVRVPARRTVDLYFAKVVGLGAMSPAVDSVAVLTGLGGIPGGAIPFGAGIDLLTGLTFGDHFVINNQANGNWGKMDIGGINTSSNPVFQNAMDNGVNSPLSVGDQVTPGTGTAGIVQGFNDIIGQTVLMPIVDTFLNGNHAVTVIGFVEVKVISASGGGQNISIDLQFVNLVTGGIGGGPGGPPFAQTRALAE